MSFHVFLSLSALFQLQAFIWGCPSLATHSSPRTPNLRGASQAQHDMKAKSSGGDLVGYKKKKNKKTTG